MVSYNKTLNTYDVTLATAGYVIGAGIYTILGVASKYGRDYTWFSVILSGILAICTGLSYSELSSMYNNNSGNYIFIREAFGNSWAKISIYIFLVGQLLIQTTVSLGLGEHIHTFVPIHPKFIASILIMVFSYMNYSGIRKSINYNNFATILEIGGLVLISCIGFMNNSNKVSYGSIQKNIYPILIGATILNFAYTGYDGAIQLTEETIDPGKTIPKGMITGIILTIILYTSVAISATKSIGWEQLSQSKTPIADIASNVLGSKTGYLMIFIALISMSNTLLMGNITASRFIQSISKYVKIPFNLDKIDEKTKTPINSIVIFTIISVIALIIGDLEKITSYSNIATVIIFIFINLAVIKLRRYMPQKKRQFKIPLNIQGVPITSVIGLLLSILFTIISVNHLLPK
tara:strand:+ start:673 stop:1887 length:1215 start_codon:yes stop_codon:yes gene_type:complete